MTNQDTCKTCRYWGRTHAWDHLPEDQRGDDGYCLIRSPGNNGFPSVSSACWCGEHEPIKAESDEPHIKAIDADGNEHEVTAQDLVNIARETNPPDQPPFPYQDNCPTMQDIMDNRAAREQD